MNRSAWSCLIAYGIMLLLYFVASFYPETRSWGINNWAHFPLWLRISVLGLGMLAGILVFLKKPSGLDKTVDEHQKIDKNKQFFLISLGLLIIFGLSFYFFRTRTHFLGDGYTLLGILEADKPLIKFRELGEAYAHIWLNNIIGGNSDNAALSSFQIISIVSGLILIPIASFVSRRLFSENSKRILFLLGLITSGYMLLFFGYVENYSLFVLSVVIYGLIGISVASGQVNKWAIILPLLLTILFHVLGVTLIPSAIYLLLRRTNFGNRFSHSNAKTKVLLALLTFIATVWVFIYFYQDNMFFRFSCVPLINGRFTVGGYTLFSFNHLVDYLNLLVLLVPGLPILVIAAYRRKWYRQFREPTYLFLGIFLLSTLGAAFIFDPKLGMARDWDLFSFSGVPLTIMLYFWLLKRPRSNVFQTKIIVLAILLSIVSLSGRIASVNTDDVATARFRNYLYLDKDLSRNAWRLLHDYYTERGDSAMVKQIKNEWEIAHPERFYFFQAYYRKNNGQIKTASKMFEKLIQSVPTYPDAWSNLGDCLLHEKKYDSAIVCLRIALGLNPYLTKAYNNLGTCHVRLGRPKDALKPLKNALSIADSVSVIHFNLSVAYIMLKNREKTLYHFEQAVAEPEAPLRVVKSIADEYVKLQKYQQAAELYHRALRLGLDSSYVLSVAKNYPPLQKYLKYSNKPLKK